MAISPLNSIAKSATAKKYTDWALKEKTAMKNNQKVTSTNYDTLQKKFPGYLMWWLSIVQCGFVVQSKTMDEDKKAPVFLNNIYSCVLGSLGEKLLGKKINNLTNKLVKRAEVVYKNDKQKAGLINGIKTAVPAAISGFLFLYLGPVIATPLSTKTADYLRQKGILKPKAVKPQ